MRSFKKLVAFFKRDTVGSALDGSVPKRLLYRITTGMGPMTMLLMKMMITKSTSTGTIPLDSHISTKM